MQFQNYVVLFIYSDYLTEQIVATGSRKHTSDYTHNVCGRTGTKTSAQS